MERPVQGPRPSHTSQTVERCCYILQWCARFRSPSILACSSVMMHSTCYWAVIAHHAATDRVLRCPLWSNNETPDWSVSATGLVHLLKWQEFVFGKGMLQTAQRNPEGSWLRQTLAACVPDNMNSQQQGFCACLSTSMSKKVHRNFTWKPTTADIYMACPRWDEQSARGCFLRVWVQHCFGRHDGDEQNAYSNLSWKQIEVDIYSSVPDEMDELLTGVMAQSLYGYFKLALHALYPLECESCISGKGEKKNAFGTAATVHLDCPETVWVIDGPQRGQSAGTEALVCRNVWRKRMDPSVHGVLSQCPPFYWVRFMFYQDRWTDWPSVKCLSVCLALFKEKAVWKGYLTALF